MPTPRISAKYPMAITKIALKTEANCDETEITLALTFSLLFSVIKAIPEGLREFSMKRTITNSIITQTLDKYSIINPLSKPKVIPINRV